MFPDANNCVYYCVVWKKKISAKYFPSYYHWLLYLYLYIFIIRGLIGRVHGNNCACQFHIPIPVSPHMRLLYETRHIYVGYYRFSPIYFIDCRAICTDIYVYRTRTCVSARMQRWRSTNSRIDSVRKPTRVNEGTRTHNSQWLAAAVENKKTFEWRLSGNVSPSEKPLCVRVNTDVRGRRQTAAAPTTVTKN